MQTTLTIVQLIDLFLLEHDVRAKSKALYRSNLNLFFRWCAVNKVDTREVRREHIIKYKADMQVGGKSTLTTNNRLTTLRLFYDWLEDCKYNAANPVVGIKNFRRYKGYRKDSLTIDQVDKLKAKINIDSTIGKRDMAIMLLMLHNGLREIEVSRLDYGDIQPLDGIYTVALWRKGRDSKDVKVRLSDMALDAISEYLASKPAQSATAPLFTVCSNNNRGIRMSSKAISNMITEYLRTSGIKSPTISPHSLRHTAGTLALENGASIYDVQQLLGHTSTNTTEIYVSQIEAKRRLYNSPVSQLDALMGSNRTFITQKAKTGTQ